MKKRLNVRLLIWTGITLVVLGACAHLLHLVQGRRNAGSLLARAALAETENRLDDATRFYTAYLTYAPDDLAALAAFARTLDRVGTPGARARALGVWERILRRQPDQIEARRSLAQAAFALGQVATARTHLHRLLKDNPDEGEAEYLLGLCDERSRQFATAAEWFEKAARHRPDLIDAHVRRVALLRFQLDRAEEADRAIDRMVALNEGSARAHLQRALYHKQDNPAAALQDVARSLELDPRHADVQLLAGELALAIGEVERACGSLREAVALDPKSAVACWTLAEAERRAGRVEAAVAALRRGLADIPDQPDLLFRLADLLLEAGQAEEVPGLLERLEKAECPPPWMDYLRAAWLIRTGRAVDALRVLDLLRTTEGLKPELMSRIYHLLAQAYAQMGDMEAELATCRTGVDRFAMSPLLRADLASVLARLGRLEEALVEYRKLATLRDAPPDTWINVARVMVQRNLKLPVWQRDLAEVNHVLDEASKRTPEVPEVPITRGEVHLAEGDPAAARKVLETALDHRPNSLPLWVALAGWSEEQGMVEQALAILAEAEKKLGDRVDLRLAKARHWARRDRLDATSHLLELEKGSDKFSTAQQAELLAGLADAWLRLGTRDEVIRLLERVGKLRPFDLRPPLAVFDLALQTGRSATADRALAEVRRIEGEEGTTWRYAEAARAVKRAQAGEKEHLATARQRLAEVAARRPDWSRAELLMAHIDELDGKATEALAHYLRAIELGDRQPSVIQRAIQLIKLHDPENRALPTLKDLSRQ